MKRLSDLQTGARAKRKRDQHVPSAYEAPFTWMSTLPDTGCTSFRFLATLWPSKKVTVVQSQSRPLKVAEKVGVNCSYIHGRYEHNWMKCLLVILPTLEIFATSRPVEHEKADKNNNNKRISRAPFHVKYAQLRWTGAKYKNTKHMQIRHPKQLNSPNNHAQ